MILRSCVGVVLFALMASLVAVTPAAEPATVDLVMLLAKEVSLVPSMGYEHEFGEVIAMLESGKVDPTALVTHHFPLSAIQDAFVMAKDTSQAIKVMVDCQS